jgi:ferredoxin
MTDKRFSAFPADENPAVCPTQAIVWERGTNVPTIISDRCINCGICARRCPFGAVYSDGKTAIVHSDEATVSFEAISDKSIRQHEAQRTTALKCHHKGSYLSPNVDSLEAVYGKLDRMKTDAQFPNLIVRNFLLTLGSQCIMRRRGDVYFRIDAIVADQPTIGVAEIDFSKDSLESPRAILDDIAVLSSRYGIGKAEIKPFIITSEFPNARSEYWRVIKDIKEVLQIRIHSLTLGVLCLLTWSFRDVHIGSVDFYADEDSQSIRAEAERLCGLGELPQANKFAVLEPKK